MFADDLTWKLAQYIILLFSLCVHEFAHAWTAHLCGDDTARLQGRLTLNPFAHIDPVGTVLIPMMQLLSPILIPIFGWARPVPVNPQRFGKYRRDDMIVSLAGIAANLVIAICAVVGLRITGVLAHNGVAIPPELFRFLAGFMLINVLLAVFNLIPIPPLDGFQFGKHFLPMSVRWNVHKLYRYGPLLLILLLMSGVLSVVVRPAYWVFFRLAGIAS